MKGRLGKALQKPKVKRRIVLSVAITSLAIVAVATLMATGVVRFPHLEHAFGVGGGSSKANDGSVSVTDPPAGDPVASGEVVSGQKDGDGVVNVWVKGINYAVPVNMDGDSWSYTYEGGLEGKNTLVFSLVKDGQWSDEVDVEYNFQEHGTAGQDTSTSTSDPSTTQSDQRSIFTPIANVFRTIVTSVTHAFGAGSDAVTGENSGDLDHNGVPDHWQGSPASPSSGWVARVPYANSIVTAVCIGIVVVGVAYIWRAKWVTSYLVKRRQLRVREKSIAASSREKELRIKAHEQESQLQASLKLKSKQLDVVGSLKREQLRAQRQVASEQLRARRSIAERQLGLAGQGLRARKDLASQGLKARVDIEKGRTLRQRLFGGGDG